MFTGWSSTRFVFGADLKSNMAARVHNVFSLAEIFETKLAYWFQRKKNLNIFPIGSYVKTMSADSGHLGWRSGSQDIILKDGHHQQT
jgi:hypothetical protein